jgi:hypothetical protein
VNQEKNVCNETHRLRGKEGALKLGPFLEESTLREAGGGAQAKGSGVATRRGVCSSALTPPT